MVMLEKYVSSTTLMMDARSGRNKDRRRFLLRLYWDAYVGITHGTTQKIIYMKLKYVGKITPRGNSINPLGRGKVKWDEEVKYLPDNLCDGLKVGRDKRSIRQRGREDTRQRRLFRSTAKQVLTVAINNVAQLKGPTSAKSVAKRWK